MDYITHCSADCKLSDNPDHRLVFLTRASARLALVESGEMTLDEAVPVNNRSFDRLVERFARENQRKPRDNRIPENWDEMSLDALWHHLNRRRPTPQTTIEAILYCVRERGLKALREPANIERLARCDADAKAQINQRIAKLGISK
jgi:hypothetical protein